MTWRKTYPPSCRRPSGADFLLFGTMRFVTLRRTCWVESATASQPSRAYNVQPVTGEQFEHRIANREDGARLDIVAQSFWGRDRPSVLFDVSVFNHTHLAIEAPPYLSAIGRTSREEEGIWRTCARNRTRLLLPIGFFSRRRHGHHRNCCVQEAGLSLGRETRKTI